MASTFWRYMPDAPKVGEVLPNSYVWDGDQPTDEELPGTCCWPTRERALRYCDWGGYLVRVEGELVCYGDEPDEVIVRNARVISVEPLPGC